MRLFLFMSVLIAAFPLFAFPDCINKEPVTEECLQTVYESGEEELYLEFYPKVQFREKEGAVARRILALYRTGRELEIPAALKDLPDKRRKTLIFRYLAFRAEFSAKKWKAARKTLEGIATDYPAFYRERALGCLEGDMFLAERKWKDALSKYTKCLREDKNEAAAFNRIVAKEQGKGADAKFIPDYLAFLDEMGYVAQRPAIRERLLSIRRAKGLPVEGSPLFVKWFAAMRKEGLADEFYCEVLTEMGYPMSLEAGRYLVGKKRYSDAITLIDREIAKCPHEECRYSYGWEKFRILSSKGVPAEGAAYMRWLAESLSGQRKERVLFHAAVSFIESNNTPAAREILEETVYKNPKSAWFLQSLYRLGLIYLMEGNEFYAYLLWGNFVFAANLKPRGAGVGDSLQTMQSLTLFYDRLFNYYLFSGSNDYECGAQDDGDCTAKDFISYYDFLYYHLADAPKLAAVKQPAAGDDERRARWKASLRTFDSDPYEELLEAVDKAPAAFRKDETVESMVFFARHRLLDGLLFYERYTRAKDLLPANAGDPVVPFVMRNLALPVYKAAEKYARIIDSIYEAIKASLKFAPQYGDTDKWKILYPVPHFDAVMKLSEEFAISPAFLYAIMRAESFYRDWVVSGAGAIGLMQIMPSTFQKISGQSGIKVKDPFNPYESLKASAWYLSKLLKRFDGNIILAAAAYNAGPKKVGQWYQQFGDLPGMSFIELIPYQETRNYAKRVARFYEIYSYLYEGSFYHLELGEPFEIKEDPTVVDF